MAAVDTFPRGAFPEYTLNCVLTEGNWMCEVVEAQCSSAVEFGVVCKSYEDLYNECSMDNNTQLTSTGPVTVSSNTSCTPDDRNDLNVATCTAIYSSLVAGIGILAALLVTVTVGWILSCIVLRKTGLKQQQ